MSGKKKALIAMSGGVDSSVAAWLMQKEGYDCIGAMMKLWDSGPEDAGGRTCCSEEDARDARSVAARIGIPFYIFNFEEEFEGSVVRPFAEAYIRGETPNPCIDCNRCMKFGRLMERMREIGCSCLATGHYARVSYDPELGLYRLRKAADASKDQSYVLCGLTQEELAQVRFPLGEYTKAQIRAVAEEQGFRNARKRDSEDICFVPDGDYGTFIEEYCGEKFPPGDFVSEDGKELGQHRGMIRYTVGQRRGLGIAADQRLYVLRKEPEENRIVLGPKEKLYRRALEADRCSFIREPEGEIFRCSAKIRYRHREAPAEAVRLSDTEVRVTFDEPQAGITPGQTVAFYDGDEVLGGGRIRESL